MKTKMGIILDGMKKDFGDFFEHAEAIAKKAEELEELDGDNFTETDELPDNLRVLTNRAGDAIVQFKKPAQAPAPKFRVQDKNIFINGLDITDYIIEYYKHEGTTFEQMNGQKAYAMGDVDITIRIKPQDWE